MVKLPKPSVSRGRKSRTKRMSTPRPPSTRNRKSVLNQGSSALQASGRPRRQCTTRRPEIRASVTVTTESRSRSTSSSVVMQRVIRITRKEPEMTLALLGPSDPEFDSDTSVYTYTGKKSQFMPLRGHIMSNVDSFESQLSEESDRYSVDLEVDCVPSRRPSSSRIHDIFDPFNRNADQKSEADIQQAVEDLNYSINCMIEDILDRFDKRRQRFKRRNINIDPTAHPVTAGLDLSTKGPMRSIYRFLNDEQNLHSATRDTILHAILHDKVNTMLYEALFEGEIFFGIPPDARKTFEDAYKNIYSREPWSVAQRWRSLAIAGTFKDLDDKAVRSFVGSLLQELTRLFIIVYPSKNPTFEKMVNEVVCSVQATAYDVFCQSQRLSFGSQHDILACRMKIIIAQGNPGYDSDCRTFDRDRSTEKSKGPRSTKRINAIGTYKFGLETIEATRRTVIVEPTAITRAILRSTDTRR